MIRILTIGVMLAAGGAGAAATSALFGNSGAACYWDGAELQCWNLAGYGFRGAPRLESPSVFYASDTGEAFCAAQGSGLKCWGDIEKDDADYGVPDEVSLGEKHQCFLMKGRARCVGVESPSLDDALGIASSGGTACALSAGRVRCWGEDVLDTATGDSVAGVLSDMKKIAIQKSKDTRPVIWLADDKGVHTLMRQETSSGTSWRLVPAFSATGGNPKKLMVAGERICVVQERGVTCNFSLPTKAKDILLGAKVGYCLRTETEVTCHRRDGSLQSGGPPSGYELASATTGTTGYDYLCFKTAVDARCFWGGNGENPFSPSNEPWPINVEGLDFVAIQEGKVVGVAKGKRIVQSRWGNELTIPLPAGRPDRLELTHVDYPDNHYYVCGQFGSEIHCMRGVSYNGWEVEKKTLPGLRHFSLAGRSKAYCALFSDRVECGGAVFGKDIFPAIAGAGEVAATKSFVCVRGEKTLDCVSYTKDARATFSMEPSDRSFRHHDGSLWIYGARGVRKISRDDTGFHDEVRRIEPVDDMAGPELGLRDGRLLTVAGGPYPYHLNYFQANEGHSRLMKSLKLFTTQVDLPYRPYLESLSRTVSQRSPSSERLDSILIRRVMAPFFAQFSEQHAGQAAYFRRRASEDAWKFFNLKEMRELRRMTGLAHRSLWHTAIDLLEGSLRAAERNIPEDPAIKELVGAAGSVRQAIKNHLEKSTPDSLAKLRGSIRDLSSAFGKGLALLEGHPAVRAQVEGDRFALWYLEGI